MHLSNQALLVILVVGVVAGWLAGKIVKGQGLGLVGDAAVGIVGALIGDCQRNHIRASSTIAARTRLLPSFPIPCS